MLLLPSCSYVARFGRISVGLEASVLRLLGSAEKNEAERCATLLRWRAWALGGPKEIGPQACQSHLATHTHNPASMHVTQSITTSSCILTCTREQIS